MDPGHVIGGKEQLGVWVKIERVLALALHVDGVASRDVLEDGVVLDEVLADIIPDVGQLPDELRCFEPFIK